MNHNIDLAAGITVQVEADSVREAVQKAKETYLNNPPEFVLTEEGNGFDITPCDGCGDLIIEGIDNFTYNDEIGHTYCTDCSDAIADDTSGEEARHES